MSIVARKSPRLGLYTGRTRQDAIADCYRSVRENLRNARYWATALRTIRNARGSKRAYAITVEALMRALQQAAEWREHARWWKRQADFGS